MRRSYARPVPWFLACLAAAGCASPSARGAAAQPAPSASPHLPRIATTHGSPPEQATQAQLQRLLREHDLSPWLFTSAVEIDENEIPHSHPVLTLSARHVLDDLLLLSTYVHEQSHWYFEQHRDATRAAMAELEAQFPGLPVGFPDGANDHDASYEHLCVNAFEYDALRRLVGELRARQVMEFWTGDHYRVLYRTVLDNYRTIVRVLRAHDLSPPPARDHRIFADPSA